MGRPPKLTTPGTSGSIYALASRAWLGEVVMSALPAVRAAVLAGGVLAAASLIPRAQAQEAPSAPAATQDNPTPRIDFRDPTTLSSGAGLDISARANDARFAPPGQSESQGGRGPRAVELQIAADGAHT